MENVSVVLHQVNDIRFENRPMPKPNPNEVLIAMQNVGICGSDIHYWKHGRIGDFVLRNPMVCGHESSGIVHEIGSNVKTLEKGNRVAIEPGISCRLCEFCKSGQYNLCPDMKFSATPPIDGSLCQYYTHPADLCFKLPNKVSLEEGALLEPLAVGVHACRRAGIQMGSKVLILGSGPIGLVSLMTAKAAGASSVTITDIDENRLKLAKQIGADFIHLVKSTDGKYTAHEITEKFGKFDQTIECSGVESSICTGIFATKSGGCIVIVGMGKAEINLPMVDALVREVDIRGIFRYANCYQTALDLVASGKVNVKPLITHRFSLEDSIKAFQTSAAYKENGAVKVMITCGKSVG